MTVFPQPSTVADLPEAGAGGGGLSAKKILQKMTELRPKTSYQTIAQFGPPEELAYVMQAEVDGLTFQGIGNSKKSAKVMAASFALLHLGEIKASDIEKPPEYSNWPISCDDFTEDIVDSTRSYIYCDFSVPYLSNKVGLRDRREGPGYVDESLKDGRQDDEYLLEVDHKTLRFLGRNPLGIMGEVLQGAEFEMLEESMEPGEPLFVAAVHTNGMTFTGAGGSKKLARARAAKEALSTLCDIQFTASAEDGMPLYEGAGDQLWQTYKAKLEADAEASLRISVADQDPQAVLRALYPSLDVQCRMVGTAGTTRHIAQYYLENDVYEAEDLTEDEACRAAAQTAVTALRVSGRLYEREREIEKSSQETLKAPKQEAEKQKDKLAQKINPISKLMQLYPPDGVKFVEHWETKLPETNITAFTMVVWMGSQPYVGVSKSKRGAKLDVAVKVLKAINKWTAEDEENIKSIHTEEDPSEIVPKHKEKVEEIRQGKIRKMLKSKGVPNELIEAGFNLYSEWNVNQGPPGGGPGMMEGGPGGMWGAQDNIPYQQGVFPPQQQPPWRPQMDGRGGGMGNNFQGDLVQYPMPQRGGGRGRGSRAHPYLRGGGGYGGGGHESNMGSNFNQSGGGGFKGPLLQQPQQQPGWKSGGDQGWKSQQNQGWKSGGDLQGWKSGDQQGWKSDQGWKSGGGVEQGWKSDQGWKAGADRGWKNEGDQGWKTGSGAGGRWQGGENTSYMGGYSTNQSGSQYGKPAGASSMDYQRQNQYNAPAQAAAAPAPAQEYYQTSSAVPATQSYYSSGGATGVYGDTLYQQYTSNTGISAGSNVSSLAASAAAYATSNAASYLSDNTGYLGAAGNTGYLGATDNTAAYAAAAGSAGYLGASGNTATYLGASGNAAAYLGASGAAASGYQAASDSLTTGYLGASGTAGYLGASSGTAGYLGANAGGLSGAGSTLGGGYGGTTAAYTTQQQWWGQ